MKKLDWYILKNFLTTFFFAIFLFTIVAVVIDVSEKADDFVKSHLSLKIIITQYYFGFVPHIIALLFPLFVFIAVIFFTSKMAGRTEIVAILASGTSYNRWLRPYYIGGILLGVMLWYANHYVVPNANKIRGNFEAKYFDPNSSYENLIKSRFGSGSDFYMKTDSFTYTGVYNYDTTYKQGGPIFMNTIKNNIVTENTRAETIRWDTTKKKWLLQNIVVRKINALGENIKFIAEQAYNLNFTPSEIKKDKYTKDKLSSPELAKFIKLEELRGSEGLSELKVEEGRRNATPVTVALLTVIGAVIAGRKVRGGSGIHLALGFIIAALFILADKFSTIFSTKGNLPPSIAVWIPNFVFLFVVIYLYRKAPK
ncbi:MAG: LptF/LptG family permease [Bacteroidetes bacterium]|nr:LptF/LptG family permease [Bacteroidota bacterium]MBS1591667.1 LptF/LptG family permease [Bacteroidota bacterium]MBS1639308.1 LptF/LptG family permease [Bacteroidota bacterium]MBS1642952.1 LptF/LptG family permease [Bacteroidota bacterium]MBS1671115.1 LptF/LptG family permease [Bacteroidota bacterium]